MTETWRDSARTRTAEPTEAQPGFQGRAGAVGGVAALVGAGLALVLIAWPHHTPPDLFRHPFTSAEFVAFQILFAVQHVGLAVALVALARSWAASGVLFRIGAWLAVAAMVFFTVVELVAIAFVDAPAAETHEGFMGGFYGLASVATGLGLLLAGVPVVRARRWRSWHRWTPLLAGLCLFLVVIPGLFAPFVVGRLTIATWMLTFAALGWALVREARAGRRPGGVRGSGATKRVGIHGFDRPENTHGGPRGEAAR